MVFSKKEPTNQIQITQLITHIERSHRTRLWRLQSDGLQWTETPGGHRLQVDVCLQPAAVPLWSSVDWDGRKVVPERNVLASCSGDDSRGRKSWFQSCPLRTSPWERNMSYMHTYFCFLLKNEGRCRVLITNRSKYDTQYFASFSVPRTAGMSKSVVVMQGSEMSN